MSNSNHVKELLYIRTQHLGPVRLRYSVLTGKMTRNNGWFWLF